MEAALTGAFLLTGEQPIVEEIFSAERLEQLAATLAAEHAISSKPQRGQRLLPRFEENGRLLSSAYKTLTDTKQAISPAAEWLVDNFHVVEEQLRQIREDLPVSYYVELPKLSKGPLQGFPRIYAIAISIIAHTDSRLDRETLRRFIVAYQQVAPLSIGELWAVAISLRLALIENLRRLTSRVVVAHEERAEADRLADGMLAAGDEDQRMSVSSLIRRLAKRKEVTGPFVVQLTRRLRDQDPDVTRLVEWVEGEMQRRGTRLEDVVHNEHQRQARSQLTVGNIITSMKLLSTIDWREFFESVSLTEPILSSDPAGAYLLMDFDTRDRYRHAIERIARRTETSELQVARVAIELATAHSLGERSAGDSPRVHVGYFLIDEGQYELERRFNYRLRLRERCQRAILRHATASYLGLIFTLTPLFVLLLVTLSARHGGTAWYLLLTALLASIPAADLAVSLINWDITHTFAPRVLPKMDSQKPLPSNSRTVVVIPTIIASKQDVQELLDRLEVHYLANQDEEIFYALLSDFADARLERMPGDDDLLEEAMTRISRLNRRYAPSGRPRFFIFHRRRLWNESEGKWIAWERKRGKLEEFNRLLRGSRDTSFEVVQGDVAFLASVRYVITLDSDTQLPRDTARKLIATISHPLNRAVMDPQEKRVVAGYGILQPRVGVTLESSVRSEFARLFGGNAGIDPYGTAASDVYQDLFGEGSFTGKGLYDVDAFSEALQMRVPDNSLLSHDLFEGLYARSALVTDIEVFDDHPASYQAWAKRQHRWIRGDWQIARWLFSKVPDAARNSTRNPLPAIARWKILDNLRRSLVPPCLVLWLLMSWSYLPGSPWWSTFFALLVAAFPVYAPATTHFLAKPRDVPWGVHVRDIRDDLVRNAKRVTLTVVFLPHQALVSCDAIARVAYRKFVSHKLLLQWVTAARVETQAQANPFALMRPLYPVCLFSLLAAIGIASFRPAAAIVALPFLLTWGLSPLFAFLVSRPRRKGTERAPLWSNERAALRVVARRTWRFFETFVGDEDHWLPPDNFQELPVPLIAHRTSPTNIGLLLLSTVSARQFGYLGVLETIERIELTLATLSRMERLEGHFFNWYDTRTLEPLNPRYVSTVDSGNLAGHLLTVKQAAIELLQTNLVDVRALDGLADTIAQLRNELGRVATIKHRGQVVTVRQLSDEIVIATGLIDAMRVRSGDAHAWTELLAELEERSSVAGDIARVLEDEHGPSANETFAEFNAWLSLLTSQIRALRCDFDVLHPIEALEKIALARLDEYGIEASSEWRTFIHSFAEVTSTAELEKRCGNGVTMLRRVSELVEKQDTGFGRDTSQFIETTIALIERSGFAALNLRDRVREISRQCESMMHDMNFRFLFDDERKLFAIGHNVSDNRRDNSFYDLLASEARLASLIAIAKGDVPQEHWFKLGRQLTQVDGGQRVLVSWGGTMFEYLMPLLVTQNYPETLLYETCRAVVARQVEYGEESGVPWGVSESAYNARDLQMNYQYGPFGVPGLGIKRGLSEELVIAPYATCLATMIDPKAALENIFRLEETGALTRYGLYEAIDYTPDRLPRNSTEVLIRSFMSHHQGMCLVALENTLFSDSMRKRFHADPLIQATELLLQERVPPNVPVVEVRGEEVVQGRLESTLLEPVAVAYDSANLPTPRTQLISNGRYSVLVTTAGSGGSTCVVPGGGSIAVTRWREDVTRDDLGTFIYVRDVKTGALWSSGYQPTARRPLSYEVAFSEERAVFKRVDAGILTQTDIVVSPEDDAEVRCLTITNQSSRTRELEVTSYAEVVIAPGAADTAHRAFSSLFVETEHVPAENALIARRRPRSSEENPIFAVHTMAVEGEAIGSLQFETSRSRFLGRGHDARRPLALLEDRPLSNTVGPVLDPVFSLRQRVRLEPHETAKVTFSLAVAHSREQALQLADKYHDTSIFERVDRMSWTHAHVQMRHLNIEPREAHVFQRLGGRLLYSDSSLRARPEVLSQNRETQSSLWKYGIGGDLPIALVRVKDDADLDILRPMLRAHEYLRLKGLQFDLAILNSDSTSYLQPLQDEIHSAIRSAGLSSLLDKPAGVHVCRVDLMPDEDRVLLNTVARVVLDSERGTLEEQLRRRPDERDPTPVFVARTAEPAHPEERAETTASLQYFNGLGGFSQDGHEYVIQLNDGQWTPAPWANIIASEKDFGFQISEAGSSSTWAVNSRENRLTPWANDAVSDPSGEAIYLRDEDTGAVWSPTPLPIREPQPYVVRHGHGYTTFEHESHDISQELTVFVPKDGTVKVSRLRLTNRSGRRRRISVTSFNELVMGVLREQSAPFVVTELHNNRTIFARNSYNNEFASRIAFLAMYPSPSSATGDRRSFLGRNGTPIDPAASRRARLDNRFGSGLDPCAALQTIVDVGPRETREVLVLLGQTETRPEAEGLIAQYLDPNAVDQALIAVQSQWREVLSSVQVKTPDKAMELMLNGWLLYQTIASRIRARSAFYQSGGAYGFRDQLQDVMALVYSHPEMTRAQILRAASRQFVEGDVQHWWHPPTGRGVRTRVSDDLLWLPYVVSFYCRVTGDQTVLDEVVPFLEGPPLEETQHEAYFLPEVSSQSATVFEHCVRAIDRSLATGAHGLPLMGSGDWNDGMNRVGHEGQGESVWLAWFLCATLKAFAKTCREHGDETARARYLAHVSTLSAALEANAWDGDWYLRAFFDDGSKLGSASNSECRIDSIAQSWALISGAGDRTRAAHAMRQVEEHLLKTGDGLVLLFTPPFDHGTKDPGYIKGYVPGVRENGGQYTHAAIWAMIAFAELGNGDKAAELFELLNPVNHSSTRAGLHKYKVEPYVVAADVYALAPHTGRGGWTWYTGSAAWMYRAGLESILGFKLRGERLRIDPCIPRSWREFEITYTISESEKATGTNSPTIYAIKVENPQGLSTGIDYIELDGVRQSEREAVLVRDGRRHNLRVVLGPGMSAIRENDEVEADVAD